MARPFFPDPAFGWVFCLTLLGLAAAAAVVDTRTGKVPNRLTVLTLALGLGFHAIRGGWLGWLGLSVWRLGGDGPVVGVLDALLYGLTGAIAAFGLMFLLWMAGTCGGGDVKLATALAGWVGLPLFVLIWAGSAVTLMVWTAARILVAGGKPRGRTTYSLPLAVATAAVVFVVFWTALGLPPVRPTPPTPPAADAASHG